MARTVKPRKPRLKGGARSTASALLDVATNPKASLEELKSLFTHLASIFSDMGNLGAGIRTHGKEIVRIVIKYLPLAGAPGFAAATAIERMPINKLIEVAASIVDFFTGKGDILTMLKAMGEVIGDIWNQLKDIIPKILEKVGAAVSSAIGSSNELTVLANAFGANYESPAVREAREEYEKEKARSAAAGAEKDRQNLIRQAAQDKEKAEYEAKVKKEAEEREAANKTQVRTDSQKQFKDGLAYHIDYALKELGYTPEEAAGYASGVPQTDMAKIAPVTKKDVEYIKAMEAKAADDYTKRGFLPPDGYVQGTVLSDEAMQKLKAEAIQTHTNKDTLWGMANDSQLKAKAYTGDKAAQQLILRYYNAIISQNGLQYLAGKGVRMAKEELMTAEDKERLARNKSLIADGESISLSETAWTKAQGGGYDPRDTATQIYKFVEGQGDTYEPRPGGGAMTGGGYGVVGRGSVRPRDPFRYVHHFAAMNGKRARTEMLDPNFFE